MVGPRDSGVAYDFMQDLAARLSHRVQLTTDGLKVYLEAVEGVFGSNIDFAQLVKFTVRQRQRDPSASMYYNFGRIHQTLRITPAMGAGVSAHVWELEDIAALADKRD
jgi:hypothetical protein